MTCSFTYYTKQFHYPHFTCDRIPRDLILCQKSDNFKWQHWDLNLSLPALKREFSNGRSPLSFSEVIVSKIYQLLADVVLPKLPLYVLPSNIFDKVNTIKYIDIGFDYPLNPQGLHFAYFYAEECHSCQWLEHNAVLGPFMFNHHWTTLQFSNYSKQFRVA